jgi:hypothetical protein
MQDLGQQSMEYRRPQSTMQVNQGVVTKSADLSP